MKAQLHCLGIGRIADACAVVSVLDDAMMRVLPHMPERPVSGNRISLQEPAILT